MLPSYAYDFEITNDKSIIWSMLFEDEMVMMRHRIIVVSSSKIRRKVPKYRMLAYLPAYYDIYVCTIEGTGTRVPFVHRTGTQSGIFRIFSGSASHFRTSMSTTRTLQLHSSTTTTLIYPSSASLWVTIGQYIPVSTVSS